MLKSIWAKLFGESIDASAVNADLERHLRHYLSCSGVGSSQTISFSNSLKVIDILREAQCCYRCCLRYLGCFNPDLYVYSLQELDLAVDYLLEKSQRTTVKTCTACLGTLQYADDHALTIQPILDQLDKEPYETTTFALTLTLPISLIHREYLLKIYVQDQVDKFNSTKADDTKCLWRASIVREAKDPIRSIVIQHLAAASGLVGELNSPFHITLCLGHVATESEHLFLTQVKDPVLRIRKVRKRGVVHSIGESRTSITSALNALTVEDARALTSIPPLPQTEISTADSILLLHDSALTGGRYNKYSRECSQTPWIIKGKRLTDLSVSECIIDILKKHHQCQDVKFVTAGREDADVRMLGTGRPFYCEMVNPRRPVLPAEEYKQMENEINTSSTSDAVKVRHLQNIKIEDTKLIKDGEESKRKTYQALIWFSEPVTQDILDRCNEKGSSAFITYQKTPIRVFQRRGAATREKTIHHMTIKRAEGDDDMNSQLAVVNLNTQAGTYIKEFVHGDLGRSQPNLGAIAGVEAADLLDLDVLEVDLAWPPVI
ncbi:hypothetical protein BCR42DRAFT_84287 [Absidia repens]|uniref:tRNA pseudouridine(55) synthase n=1 Tax=Absidia repens TaxID=90262 RepID=A0A1X2IXI7_9FUNG|nr:hypothetical protein BCR42DRAFT_84287 [Absidia repens]